MKLKKLFASVALAGIITACIPLAACNSGNNVDNSVENTTELQIMVINRGYGVDWLHKLGEAFGEKKGVKVTVIPVIETQTFTNSFQSGIENNDVDLYFTVSEEQSAALRDSLSGVDGGLYDLTDLYDTEIPGENITYGKKMNATVRSELETDGHYYTVPWATATLGIFYNETVLNNVLGSWEMPVTSQELIELADRFTQNAVNKNKFLIYAGALDLIGRTLFLPWWAQYEGIENYEAFFDGRCYDEEEGAWVGNSVRIYSQTGRLKALQEIEKLCRSTNGYAIENASAYNQNNYKELQVRYFISQQGMALYPCGDWLEQESASNSDSVVKMMKMPVLSSITEQCPTIDGQESDGDTDAELSALIKAIDAGSPALSGTGYSVSQTDYDKVKEARNTMASMSNFHIGYIPAYANAKGLATEFLLFMASDEGISIYKENTKGGFLPFAYEYDNNELTTLEQSVYEVSADANFVQFSKRNPIFYKGNAQSYKMNSDSIDVALNVVEASSAYKTAEDIYNWFIEKYTANNNAEWNAVLAKLA